MGESEAQVCHGANRAERCSEQDRLKPTRERHETNAATALQQQTPFRKQLFPENPRQFRHAPPATVFQSSAAHASTATDRGPSRAHWQMEVVERYGQLRQYLQP